MGDPESQNGADRPAKGSGRWRAVLAALLAAIVIFAAGASAQSPPPVPGGEETAGVDTAIGRLGYHAGRGLRFGDTGLTIGGFATLQGERLEEGESRGGIEGVNPFLIFDPTPFLHVFSELEVSGIAEGESGRDGVRSDPGVKVERLFLDAGASDALNVRFGKFLTPIGRWNPAPAEPFVWTTSEPMITEEVFDETSTGAMLWGAAFPRGGAFSYSLYGTFLDPIAPDRDAPPASHSAGTYFEWASLSGWSVGASYFASGRAEGSWNHLGGADALWSPTERVELTAEAVFGEGTRGNGALWGTYVQAAVETVPTLWAVGRYERFDPPGRGRSIDLVDLGLAWIPVPWLRVKTDYLLADHLDETVAELAEPGFRASLSVIF